MPTMSAYGIWVPLPVDVPLPLMKSGDETELTLCGLKIRAIFNPGHSIDSMLYVMEFNGKRVVFTGDMGFDGGSHILHRCWGDVEKAKQVVQVVRSKILPLKVDHVFTGHGVRQEGSAFLERLLKASDDAIAQATRK
jgi:glyoxylase-like metal-dependent hydrolase (beta-lactamase superfamily II)